MFWEIVATAVAGVGAGGLGFAARRISANRLPRWLVPAFAALAMLSVQIYSEYSWFDHQRQLLPPAVTVVKPVQERTWRPWSWVFPQTTRFLAVDTGNATANRNNPALILADVYAFQRRLPAQRVRQVFHCEQLAWAVFADELVIPRTGETVAGEPWRFVDANDPLLRAACSR